MTARSQEIIIEVAGMRSDTDVALLTSALRELAGVRAASASLAESLATVTADPTIASPELLRAAVVAAGFSPGEVRFPE
jgi:copper chaperone CopZ